MLRFERVLALFAAASLSAACGESKGPRLVTIGDNVSSNPTFRTSWVGLFEENDDALFPSFAGKDVKAAIAADARIVRLDRGGDSYHSIASGTAPLCTCAGEACAAEGERCLDTREDVRTVVIVELGGNDLLSQFLTLLSREDLRQDPSPLVEQLRADVRGVLATTQDRTVFATAPEVLVMNAYDPSDGVGDLAAIAASILPPSFDIDVSVVTTTLALSLIDSFNGIIREEAGAMGAAVIDTHTHFLGHGYHYDDAGHPNHDEADATQWIRGVFDPTLRGAHELRRLVWNALSSAPITDVPVNLPPDAVLGLPAVPANGWAKAIVDAEVTQELYSEATDVSWPNESKDPALALGPPEGAVQAVAIGVLGAYIVVDLGADTAATDGEGDDLVVLEQGTQSGGVPEPYRVSVASAPNGPFTTIADGSGERAFDLGLAGINGARYVKVESLAAAVDVLGGVGSPVAPGPEIDAIGAVHPGASR